MSLSNTRFTSANFKTDVGSGVVNGWGLFNPTPGGTAPKQHTADTVPPGRVLLVEALSATEDHLGDAEVQVKFPKEFMDHFTNFAEPGDNQKAKGGWYTITNMSARQNLFLKHGDLFILPPATQIRQRGKTGRPVHGEFSGFLANEDALVDA